MGSYHVTAHDPGRCSARRTSSAAATAVPARTDGRFERPNIQCKHAPRTIANGNPSTAHGTQGGRKAPDSTPRRMTADRIQVPRCTNSRRASSARTVRRDGSSAGSETACVTVFQMASIVLRSAVTGSSSGLPASSTARSAASMRAGKSNPDCRTPRRTAPDDLSATTCKAFMATRSRYPTQRHVRRRIPIRRQARYCTIVSILLWVLTRIVGGIQIFKAPTS